MKYVYFLVFAIFALMVGTTNLEAEGLGPNLDFVGSYDTDGHSRGVTISGNYAYIADYANGLVIFGLDTDNDEVADLIDVFPNDSTEWLDSDGDGVGDNADKFEDDKAASVDSDNDGYPNEWNQGMGVVNSSTFLTIDVFPNDSNEWLDSDGDGIGNNADKFEDDKAASIDSDNDGYPDKWNPDMSKRDSSTFLSIDIFPNDSTEWLDSDGDGVGDNSDRMPNLSYIQSNFQIALYSILTLGSLYVSVGFYFTKNLIAEIQKLVEIKRKQGVNTKKVEELISEGRFWFKYFIFSQSAFFIRTAERELNLLSDKYESNNRFILQVKDNLELMEKQGPILEKSNDLLEQSKELFFDYKFEESQELVKKAEHIAKETTQTYLSIKENIDELKITIKYFKKKGIKTDKLELMLKEFEKEVEEK